MGNVNDKPIEIQDDNLKIVSPLSQSGQINTIKENYQTSSDNVNKFSLLWADPQVNKTDENRRAQQKLQEIIDNFKTFDDPKQCEQYILRLSPQDRVVLIVSGQCGRQLVPKIHQLRQLSCIYVYCMNKQANDEWAKNFTKVRSVIINLDELINEIKQDHKSQLRIEEAISMNIYTVNDNPDQSTTGLNGHFVHSLLLIDVLIRMKSVASEKKTFITSARKKYENNKKELAAVDEFEHEYSAKNACFWYSRDSFLYKMLNEALRMQDIDLLYIFRFFITDIYQQLKQYQCRSVVRVYRGQVIKDVELQKLRQLKGEFISINSFFSTSRDDKIAMKFLTSAANSDNLRRVLFIIDADPSVVSSKPFADIHTIAQYTGEYEVLFMVGSIFRINDIHQDNENEKIWKIRMKLCGDKENDLKNLFDHMKKDYGGGNGKVTPLSFADVLREMGKYDLAEQIYSRLLIELPSCDPSFPALYWSLGMLSKEKGNYDKGLDWFHQALVIYMRTNPSDYIHIGDLYNWIGEMHRLKKEYHTALKYFNDAAKIFEQAHDENHRSMGYVYNNIAIIHKQQKNYSEALKFYEKSLIIRRKHLPSNHPDIASSYNNIANVYLDLKRYDLAMQHHKEALKIRLKSCTSQHPDIGMSYRNIGYVHQSKCEWKEAMDSYQKAATIYRHSLKSTHPNVIQIEEDIKYVSTRLY